MACAELFADRYGFATLQRREQIKELGDKRLEIIQPVARSRQDHDSNVEFRQVLLERQVSVNGDENFKLPFRTGKQFPILDRVPAHLGDRTDRMST